MAGRKRQCRSGSPRRHRMFDYERCLMRHGYQPYRCRTNYFPIITPWLRVLGVDEVFVLGHFLALAVEGDWIVAGGFVPWLIMEADGLSGELLHGMGLGRIRGALNRLIARGLAETANLTVGKAAPTMCVRIDVDRLDGMAAALER